MSDDIPAAAIEALEKIRAEDDLRLAAVAREYAAEMAELRDRYGEERRSLAPSQARWDLYERMHERRVRRLRAQRALVGGLPDAEERLAAAREQLSVASVALFDREGVDVERLVAIQAAYQDGIRRAWEDFHRSLHRVEPPPEEVK